MVAYWMADAVCNVIGVAYPGYMTFKALKRRKMREYQEVIMYWIVYALFICTTYFTDIFLSWIPLYYELKIVFVIWLVLPSTKGSYYVYKQFVHGWLNEHEPDIDDALDSATENLADLGAVAKQKVASVALEAMNKGHSMVMDSMRDNMESSQLKLRSSEPSGNSRRGSRHEDNLRDSRRSSRYDDDSGGSRRSSRYEDDLSEDELRDERGERNPDRHWSRRPSKQLLVQPPHEPDDDSQFTRRSSRRTRSMTNRAKKRVASAEVVREDLVAQGAPVGVLDEINMGFDATDDSGSWGEYLQSMPSIIMEAMSPTKTAAATRNDGTERQK